MHICVFSSSSNAIPEIYFDEGRKLGRLIGLQGHTLVNGGANVGLMETVTVEASRNGAKTIGIIPERFAERSLASENSHEIITTRDMMERKAKMREMSDAFIALPGGFGTIEEILEVLTLRQVNYHRKPVVFVNTNNFFEHLFQQFEVSFEQNFAKDIYRALYYSAKDSEDAMEFITRYKPVELDAKWYIVPFK
ncbi:MAG: TIGR00730 family Rossman fold protein [Bacteroidota bacterium]